MKFGYNGLVAFGMFEIIDYDRPDNGRVIMKGFVQRNSVNVQEDSALSGA